MRWLRIVKAASVVVALVSAFGVEPGEVAPVLKGVGVIQQGGRFKEQSEGRVRVVDFWATWCGPCVESIPHWNELVGEFAGKEVEFVAVSDENEAVVKRFLKQRPITSAVAVEGPGASLRDLYGITGIPTTVLINKEGKVAAMTHPALLKAENIEEVLRTGKSSLAPIAAVGNSRKDGSEPVQDDVNAAPPILELKVKRSGPRQPGRGFNGWSFNTERTEFGGDHATVEAAILNVFQGRKSLLELQTALPSEDYDFKIRVPALEPAEREELFRSFFNASFALRVSRKTALRDVWVAKLVDTNGPGMNEPVPGQLGGGGDGPGKIDLRASTIASVLGYFENWTGKTIIDETGLTNRYDFHLRWKLSKAELALLSADQQVVQALFSGVAQDEQHLSTEQARLLKAMKGTLPKKEMKGFSEEEQDEFPAIAAEMRKPEDDRFKPSEETVIAMAREQLGIEFKPERRLMEVLVVRR